MDTIVSPLISIIVPVYNVEDYLERCLTSLRQQTFEDFEVICINDGSTDKSFEILQLTASSDTRFKIISKQNGGVSAARNDGITHSQGSYISFIDADDWVDEKYIEVLTKCINDNNPDIVVFSGKSHPKIDWVDRSMDTRASTMGFVGFDALLHRNGCTPFICNKLYRSSIFKKNNILFDTSLSLGEDLVLQFSVFPYSQSTYFIDNKLYHYRLNRAGSAMSSIIHKKEQLMTHIELLKRIVMLWTQKGWLENRQEELLEATRFLFIDMVELTTSDFKEVSSVLLHFIDSTFGEDIYRQMNVPEPKNFYTLIRKSVRRDSVMRNIEFEILKCRYRLRK